MDDQTPESPPEPPKSEQVEREPPPPFEPDPELIGYLEREQRGAPKPR